LQGDAGVDRFVFQPGFGNDTISGFDAVGINQDFIFLTSAFTNVQFTQSGDTVIISSPDFADTITVTNPGGVTVADVQGNIVFF